MTKTSRIYDFERDQLVTPSEALQLQGLPVACMDISESSDFVAYQAAGQGFFCPSVSTLLLAFFLNHHAPWWMQCPDTDVEEA